MGADLSIERDPERLLEGRGTFLAGFVAQLLCYLLGISGIGMALWRRRQADVDPAITARQGVLTRQLERVKTAASVREMADAIRQMAAASTDFPRQALSRVLERCDMLVFAPGGQQAGVDEALRADAVRLAQRMMENKT